MVSVQNDNCYSSVQHVVGAIAPQFAQAGYRTVVLPSSSPAHIAMSFEQKLAVWRGLAQGRGCYRCPTGPVLITGSGSAPHPAAHPC